MLQTPLHGYHLQHGGKMVDFAGWSMPMYYSPPAGAAAAAGWTGGILDEHHQVRRSGGLFDVSHMGRVKMSGRHARRLLDRLCTRRIDDMTPGQCRYSLVCNELGGIRDDVIVYRMDEDEFLVVVNASNREKLLAHFEKTRAENDWTVKIHDQTAETAMVALQGPKVMDFVAKFSSEIPSLKRYRFAVKNLLILKLIVSRTGYTGEDGVEVILSASAVDMALKLLLEDAKAGEADALIRPAGLGARDTLRLEAGMPLYGHELTEESNALSTGLDFAIAMDKPADEQGRRFIGHEALARTKAEGGPRSKLVGFKLDGKRTARQGMRVLSGESHIGEVTSACLSPTLGFPIGMAYVNADKAADATPLRIDTGRGFLDGATCKPLFYSPTRKP